MIARRRRGLSLLEVLVALAIFLMGMIAIGRLVILAGDRALEVKLEGQATQLCQAKLAEVVAGAVPLSSQNGAAFDEDPAWQWSLEAEQDSIQGMWRVKVTVSRDQPGGSKIECAMSQFMLDPSLRGSTLTAAATPVGAQNSSSSATGSGTSSDSTSGTSSTPAGKTKGSGTPSGKPGPPKGGPAPPPSSGGSKGSPAPPGKSKGGS